MTDADRIEAAIDRPWEQLLVLADLCEEQGKPRLADGYRWLAEQRRWPLAARPRGVRWNVSDRWMHRLEDCLPKGMLLRKLHFEKPSEALRAAALAIGNWLDGRGLVVQVDEAKGVVSARHSKGGKHAARAWFLDAGHREASFEAWDGQRFVHAGFRDAAHAIMTRTLAASDEFRRAIDAHLAYCPLEE